MIPVFCQPVSPRVEVAAGAAILARCRSEGHVSILPSKQREISKKREDRWARIADFVSANPGLTSKQICAAFPDNSKSMILKDIAALVTAERIYYRRAAKADPLYFLKASGDTTPPATTMAEGGPQS